MNGGRTGRSRLKLGDVVRKGNGAGSNAALLYSTGCTAQQETGRLTYNAPACDCMCEICILYPFYGGPFIHSSMEALYGVRRYVFASCLKVFTYCLACVYRSVFGRLDGPVARSAVLRAEEAERGAVLPELAAGKDPSGREAEISRVLSSLLKSLLAFVLRELELTSCTS